MDIQAKQSGILVSQQLSPISQLAILTSLLPILHNQEDILLQPMLAFLVQGACHIQPSLLKGCLVCFIQEIISLDLLLARVATNNTIQGSNPTLLPVQHSHPRHLPSTLL